MLGTDSFWKMSIIIIGFWKMSIIIIIVVVPSLFFLYLLFLLNLKQVKQIRSKFRGTFTIPRIIIIYVCILSQNLDKTDKLPSYSIQQAQYSPWSSPQHAHIHAWPPLSLEQTQSVAGFQRERIITKLMGFHLYGYIMPKKKKSRDSPYCLDWTKWSCWNPYDKEL